MYVSVWRCGPVRVSCRFSSPEGPGKAAGGLSPEPQGTPPGSTPRRVFPRGLPSEFALVLTLLLKKHTHQNTWYLFQVTDGDGYPQVSQTTTPLPPRGSWGIEQSQSSPTSVPACEFRGSVPHPQCPPSRLPLPQRLLPYQLSPLSGLQCPLLRNDLESPELCSTEPMGL